MSYKIGSFNLRKLSFSTNAGDGKSVTRDYSTIGKIIRDNFDIVALQEVMNDNVLKILFPPSNTLGWQCSWIPSGDEGYAFAWNPRRIRAISEPEVWKQYKPDPMLGKSGLLRPPYYGRFTPSGTISRGPFFEFRLINVHIRYDPPKANEQLSASSHELRKAEFRTLTEQILRRIEDKRYGNNMPAYTFLLGDYNLNLKESNAKSPYVQEFVYIEDSRNRKKFITVQKKLTTLSSNKRVDPKTGTEETVFEGYANNYDHFTYDEIFFDERGIRLNSDALDTVSLYCGGDFEKYWREISDHIPIILEVNLK